MKKAFLFSMILCVIIASPSYSMIDPVVVDKNGSAPKGIRSLEINADVTVVLGHFGSQQAFMDGDLPSRDKIIIKQNGSHLVIGSSTKRDLRAKVVIFISAELLTEVRINSSAYVHSSGLLQTPLLDVFVNGTCEIMIAITGHLNLVPSDHFDIEYRSKQNQSPLTFYRSRYK